MTEFLIWYIVGILSWIGGTIAIDNKLSIKDIVQSLLWGVLGFIMTILVLILFFKDYEFSDETKAKWNNLKPKWNKNLLNTIPKDDSD
jgi:hypothetical protein